MYFMKKSAYYEILHNFFTVEVALFRFFSGIQSLFEHFKACVSVDLGFFQRVVNGNFRCLRRLLSVNKKTKISSI